MKIFGFKEVSYTGVIYVMSEALKHGYSNDDPEWANLGRGAPEISTLTNCNYIEPLSVPLDPLDSEYGPVDGLLILRKKIADYYNFFYRQGHTSQYTFENVTVCSGARIALARTLLALGNINLAHFIPDYTAYEELLGSMKSFNTIPYLLKPEIRYHLPLEQLEQEIKSRGLQCILKSNPSNPTGQVIMGNHLKEFTNILIRNQCSLIIDEIYSHYIYENFNHDDMPRTVSAAKYVNNIDEDPIIIINGLSKNWRHPGWRIGWVVGPKKIIQSIGSVGSFLDGGPSTALQRLATSMLEPSVLCHDIPILQNHFQLKRDYMMHRLRQMGIVVDAEPLATFYIWANLSQLPAPLRDGFKFFEMCLKNKVILIPGIFFDVNPDKRRPSTSFKEYIRFSFGPDMETIKRGLDKIEKIITSFKKVNPTKTETKKIDKKSGIILSRVQDESKMHEIFQLRYDAAVGLGYDHPDMDHATKTFKDEFDNKSVIICASDEGKDIGTIRGVLFRDFPNTNFELIEKHQVLNFRDASVNNSMEVNRFVVLKEYQKYDVAMMLMVELVKRCLEVNPELKYAFIECIASLTTYYEFFKFKKLGKPIFSELYKTQLYAMYLERDDFLKIFNPNISKQ